MELFDFVKAIFTYSKSKFGEIPDNIKKRHFFMTQRIISINFPEQTNSFNLLNIDQVSVMNFWNMVMSRKYSGTPKWAFDYSKTVKTATEAKKKEIKHSAEIIKLYKEKYELDEKQYNEIVNFFPDDLSAELKIIEQYD